jgi:regulator of CtrA degradation
MSADRIDGTDDVQFVGGQFAGEEVSFAEFMSSGLFQRTYQEGMRLVEETSAYLDGPGREVSRNLSRDASLAYAGESMRLTTRLMQVAAWLLVRKAVHEGEITPEEAMAEKYRLASKEIARSARLAGAHALPDRLLELISRSELLYARVERLDTQLRERPRFVEASHPMAEQFNRVEAFFRETLGQELKRDRG